MDNNDNVVDVNSVEPTCLSKIVISPRIKEVVQTSIDAYFNDKLVGRKPSYGPLGFVGPSGCGKSLVAKAVAASTNSTFIEVVGSYDPLGEEHKIELKEDRIYHWLEKGAQPSDTVRSLLRQRGILHRLNLQKLGYDEAKINEEMKKWELLQSERIKRRETAKIQKKTLLKLLAKIQLMISEKQLVVSQNDLLVNYLWSFYKEISKLLEATRDPEAKVDLVNITSIITQIKTETTRFV